MYADEMPPFRFTNYRKFPKGDYDNETAWGAPWLRQEDFSASETAQLKAVCGFGEQSISDPRSATRQHGQLCAGR